jgi:ribosomal protein S18 acetylase RimI-like enzyme
VTTPEVRTRPFSGDDREAVVVVLSHAFAEDPLVRWFLPPREGGADRLARFFRVTLARDVLPYGEAHVAEHDGAIVGAALWRRPGEWNTTGRRQLLDLPWWLGVFGRDLLRAGTGLDTMKAVHPVAPHWYLPTIGVDPGAQGLGVGSALLEVILRRCDADRTPAYLESSKSRNIGFYERHGFTVSEERRLPNGPPFWPMWRDPRP